MPNTLLFNPQMATERGKDYFSNNKFFKLYNSITNNSTMNFNGGVEFIWRKSNYHSR